MFVCRLCFFALVLTGLSSTPKAVCLVGAALGVLLAVVVYRWANNSAGCCNFFSLVCPFCCFFSSSFSQSVLLSSPCGGGQAEAAVNGLSGGTLLCALCDARNNKGSACIVTFLSFRWVSFQSTLVYLLFRMGKEVLSTRKWCKCAIYS